MEQNCRTKHLTKSGETHSGFRLLHLGDTPSAAVWSSIVDGERRPLCKLQTKVGTFEIWKIKSVAGTFVYYLDCWGQSYSCFLCRNYERAKAEVVANLKVDRWGEQSRVWGEARLWRIVRRENTHSLQMRAKTFSLGTTDQSNSYL